jgi:NlpC/P60 family putative phage cell wall peptidase
MPNKIAIVEEARTWIGTPFKHQGRIKGLGVDCVGLIIGVAHFFKLTDFDYRNYSHTPDGFLMRQLLDQHLRSISIQDAKPGDIVLMRFEAEPQHVGILSDYGIIHAYAQVRHCVEHRLDNIWKSRIVGAYAYPHIENV